jgi:hypothetical protein
MTLADGRFLCLRTGAGGEHLGDVGECRHEIVGVAWRLRLGRLALRRRGKCSEQVFDFVREGRLGLRGGVNIDCDAFAGVDLVELVSVREPTKPRETKCATDDPLNVRGAFSDGDDGRLPDEVDEALEGAFRTPSLRCVSRRPSFMRTAQYRNLGDVVSFFAKGGHEDGYLGTKEIGPLELDADERHALTAFLGALDGPGPGAELVSAP